MSYGVLAALLALGLSVFQLREARKERIAASEAMTNAMEANDRADESVRKVKALAVQVQAAETRVQAAETRVQEALELASQAEQTTRSLGSLVQQARESIVDIQSILQTVTTQGEALEKVVEQTTSRVEALLARAQAVDQALRPRTLTREQRHVLIQRLREGPKGRVSIEYTAGDAEADRFATQLYEVLILAGWPKEPLGQVTLIGGQLPIGLQVGLSQEKSERLAGKQAALPPHGEYLLQVLRDVGLQVSLKRTLYQGPAEIVHLVVGAKPPLRP